MRTPHHRHGYRDLRYSLGILPPLGTSFTLPERRVFLWYNGSSTSLLNGLHLLSRVDSCHRKSVVRTYYFLVGTSCAPYVLYDQITGLRVLPNKQRGGVLRITVLIQEIKSSYLFRRYIYTGCQFTLTYI